MKILADASSAADLDGAVDDLLRHVRGHHLDHRDLGAGTLIADRVHHVRGTQRQQPRLVDLHARLRDPLADDAMVRDIAAEGMTAERALAQGLERPLGNADEPHAMVNAAGPEPALRDFEAASLPQQDVRDRHPHVLEDHLGVAVRRVVVAKYAQCAHDIDARRSERHQHHRLAFVWLRLRIGQPHDDCNLAAPVHCARRPPFAAVDDVMVAVAPDLSADIGGVRRGDRRFRHRKAGADFAVHQRLEPTALLLLAAVKDERLHVAGIGGRAVERLGTNRRAAHNFA